MENANLFRESRPENSKRVVPNHGDERYGVARIIRTMKYLAHEANVVHAGCPVAIALVVAVADAQGGARVGTCLAMGRKVIFVQPAPRFH
jgi:hypothetical protein